MSITASEIGTSIQTGNYSTNYHDVGEGEPIIFLHGSGAGVSGWANWRGTIANLSQQFRTLAPDLVGFGYTEIRDDQEFHIYDTWLDQVVDFMDGLGIEQAHLVGNSFGGGLALHLAVRHPDRVRRIALMGAGGIKQEMNANLHELWNYTPSVENMKKLMDIMAYDRSLVTDELAQLRYEATIRPGVMEAMGRMFPEPQQAHLDAEVVAEDDLRSLPHETLIFHGRDDSVVPFENSLTMFNLIPNAQLHGFGKCGHWTQIEHAARFQELLNDFFSEGSQ